MLLVQRSLNTIYCGFLIALNVFGLRIFWRALNDERIGELLFAQVDKLTFAIYPLVIVLLASTAMLRPKLLIIIPITYLLFSFAAFVQGVARETLEMPPIPGVIVNVVVPFALWRWRIFLERRVPMPSPAEEF